MVVGWTSTQLMDVNIGLGPWPWSITNYWIFTWRLNYNLYFSVSQQQFIELHSLIQKSLQQPLDKRAKTKWTSLKEFTIRSVKSLGWSKWLELPYNRLVFCTIIASSIPIRIVRIIDWKYLSHTATIMEIHVL